MTTPLPTEAGIIAARAPGVVVGGEVAVRVKVSGAWPDTALRPSISLTSVLHPTLRDQLLSTGWVEHGEGVSTRSIRAARAGLSCVDPSRVWPETSRGVNLHAQDETRRRHLRRCATEHLRRGASSTGLETVVLSYLRDITDGGDAPGGVVMSFERGSIHLRAFVPEIGNTGVIECYVEQAEDIIDELVEAGVVVYEQGDGGGIDRLRQWYDRLTVVRPGDQLDRAVVVHIDRNDMTSTELPLAALGDEADRWFTQDRKLVVDDRVLDLVDMVEASTTGRPGLSTAQDTFCSMYLAARRGMVCAIEPGGGKTVAAVTAVRERYERALDRGHTYHALVSVPSGLVEQWMDEFEAWAPQVPARTRYEAWQETSGVMLATHQGLSRIRDRVLVDAVRIDDLVVDEAHLVRGAGQSVIADLRRAARRGMMLSGTPARGVGRNGADLVRLAVGDGLGDFVHAHGIDGMYPVLYRGAVAGAWQREVDVVYHDSECAGLEQWVKAVGAAFQALCTTERERRMIRALSREGAMLRRRAAECRAQLRREIDRFVLEQARNDIDTTLRVADGCGGPSLVFCEDLALRKTILGHWHGAVLLDGSVRPERRADIGKAFEAGEIDRLVLSRVASVGLNLQRAATAVFADVPVESELLIQRIGRAARMGHDGTAVTIHAPAGENGSLRAVMRAVVAGNGVDDPWFASRLSSRDGR